MSLYHHAPANSIGGKDQHQTTRHCATESDILFDDGNDVRTVDRVVTEVLEECSCGFETIVDRWLKCLKLEPIPDVTGKAHYHHHGIRFTGGNIERFQVRS